MIGEKFKKLSFYIVGLFSLIGIVMVFTFATSAKSAVTTSANMKASSIDIPEKMEFAGENVPLNYFDVQESLEREMLINTYWHSQSLMLIKRSTRHFGIIEAILKKNNIPDDFKFLALAESGLTNVTSPAGAVGFWQFMPATAKDYGLEVNSEVDERYHIEKATEAACRFLQESYNLYHSWTLAAASYNMGRKNLNSQIARQYTTNYYDILLNEETARYVFRIVALKLIINDPKKYGFEISDDEYYKSIPFSEQKITSTITDLAKFAFENHTNYKMLKYLNPWLRDNILTVKSGKNYTIKIPKEGFREISKIAEKDDIDRILSQSEKLKE